MFSVRNVYHMIAEKKITHIIYEIEINSSEIINVVAPPQQPRCRRGAVVKGVEHISTIVLVNI